MDFEGPLLFKQFLWPSNNKIKHPIFGFTCNSEIDDSDPLGTKTWTFTSGLDHMYFEYKSCKRLSLKN